MATPPPKPWKLPIAREEPFSLRAPRAPATDPPTSAVGKRWNPLGVAFAAAAVFGSATTFGVAIGPYLSKPDLSDYVKADRLTVCEARTTAGAEAGEKAIDRERDRTSACFDKLGACQSQQGAKDQVIESMGAKKRR